MSATLDGTNGLTFNDSTKMGSANSLGMRNILFNADFRINQRGYVSAGTLAAGAYGHDRFKAGASGGNYSFTQLASSTQITIASGKSLIQVVEDKNVVGGSYVLSWTGTALGRVGVNSATPSGTFVVSPILIAGQTAGTTMSVEFNAGTLNTAQLEQGSVATPFERRPIGLELALCQRYCLVDTNANQAYRAFGTGTTVGTTSGVITRQLPVPMRTTPSITPSSGTVFLADVGATAPTTTSVTDNGFGSPMIVRLAFAVASGLSAGQSVILVSDGSSTLRSITYSAEL
jgi:hypothetical protein